MDLCLFKWDVYLFLCDRPRIIQQPVQDVHRVRLKIAGIVSSPDCECRVSCDRRWMDGLKLLYDDGLSILDFPEYTLSVFCSWVLVFYDLTGLLFFNRGVNHHVLFVFTERQPDTLRCFMWLPRRSYIVKPMRLEFTLTYSHVRPCDWLFPAVPIR